MIRRPVLLEGNTPGWALIPQIEHARLAGWLAADWQSKDLRRSPGHAEFISAVFHHDDGWPAWDSSPQMDPVRGRPWAFDEMPWDQSLPLWSESIDRCAALGHLAAYVVRRHFLALLSHSRSAERATGGVRETIDTFRTLHESRCQNEAECWRRLDLARKDPNQLEMSFRWLRFFDALSLWLCCQRRSEPETFESPDEFAWNFAPLGDWSFQVTPWPFEESTRRISLAGVQAPVARYESAADLFRAARPEEFHLILMSGERALVRKVHPVGIVAT